ncbi:MAG: ATP-binding cassette domain-containing protein [Prevotella sp.]|jgi:cell division transport system ATP-binding protein|nr:ATP-binding cassette domain-containing protein [Prevotella sp.]
MSLISYKNANIYQRHGICVLKNVTFHVEEGQFIYLIGRVGSGKTTLMRTLYCELDVDEADEATVLGHDLLTIRRKEIPALRREMGVVFQDFQLLADRSVYKNLEFVLKATGWKKRDGIDERIEEVLKAVGLEDKADRMPFELSGGEQQRVAIARAILNKPKLILADEPTGNLDPETSAEIIKLLFQISHEGTAVVMSTHNLPLIEENPSITYRCHDAIMEDVTNDFHHLIIIDDTPDTDETKVRYSEREEI